MAKSRKPPVVAPKKNPYLRGLRRADGNFDGQAQNGFSGLYSGGGWMNSVTGLGTFSRDKMMQAAFGDSLRITDPELSSLFHGNDLAARIIEKRPKEMFREGYELCLPDPEGDKVGQNGNAELALELEKYAANLKANELMLWGCIMGRTFGGDLLIVGADDGQDMALPLREDKIKTIRYLNNIDRRFIFARTYYNDPFEPNFGEVETYQVTNAFGDQQNSVVHETRVIRFDGSPVEILKRRQLAGWTLSVLQRPYDVLRNFDQSFQSAANLIGDMSQAVFKIKGLMEMISSNGLKDVQDRMAVVDMFRSSARALVLDSEEEDFERTVTPMTGLSDVLQLFMQRLASAADMPITILFGREPSGLNATGEADFQHFYDTIASDQVHQMQPHLLRLFKLICLAKDSPCKGQEPPDGLEIHWHPLKKPNSLEQAELQNKQSMTDKNYVDSMVLLPQEVALSRFRGGKFRLDTEIDIEARKKSMEADLDFHVQAAEQKAADGPPQQELAPGEPANPQLAPPGMQGAKQNPQTGRAP